MRKTTTIDRFIYEDIEYHICANYFEFNEYNIAEPYIMITNKSSKRKRGSTNDKRDAHFLRVDVKEPIVLARKILNIYKRNFENVHCLIVSAYDDSKYKRDRLYNTALQRIDFTLFKEFRLYRSSCRLFINSKIKIKNKTINNILNSYIKSFE